jgi:hypothetical protein
MFERLRPKWQSKAEKKRDATKLDAAPMDFHLRVSFLHDQSVNPSEIP